MDNDNLLDLYRKYFVEIYNPVDFIPIRGNGVHLYDANDNELIDFAGGVAVSALGYANPQLIERLNIQAQQIWHTGNIFTNVPQIELAKRLIENTCFDRLFLCNSGTEAVECALKIARRYAVKTYGPHKNKIVSFHRAYHGRTLFAVTTGGQSKYWDGFEPLPAGIGHAQFNDINSLKQNLSSDVAAVIIELIQAESGVRLADHKFVTELAALCKEYNIALIVDEVQTGMGRTGKLFAYMNYGIEPDIIAVAKALGGGFPIGATLVKEQFSSGFGFATHGSTFGGNPLAASVACCVFDMINTKDLLDSVVIKHDILVNELTKINNELQIYKEIRGIGLIIGAELDDKYKGRAAEVVHLAPKHGVAILNAGANVTRFLPPLIISKEEIIEGLARLKNVLLEFKG